MTIRTNQSIGSTHTSPHYTDSDIRRLYAPGDMHHTHKHAHVHIKVANLIK